jgi:inosine-uridine nucleoside N-ribohydrolase
MVARIAGHHQHPATDTLLHAVEFYARFYTGLYAHVAHEPGCFAHDVLAFIYLVSPELFTVANGSIRVATEGLGQGQTMMNRRDFIRYPQAGWESDKPLTQVCMQVRAQECKTAFEETLMGSWLSH